MATDFLPPTFLLGPPANPEKKVIDFEKTALPEYKGLYAAVLDGCFSKEECDLLVQAAEAQTNGTWEQAMVNVGGGRQIMATDIRNCGRIIWDDRELVARIWNRINPVMGEIQNLKNQEAVSGLGLVKRREVWEMSRLNERMRFLKYGDGQYFKPHVDGSFATENNEEISFYTLHLYLNESNPDVEGRKLVGGATTFHHPYGWFDESGPTLDVVPKVGRVLIFQHKGLVHSGADVVSGTKLTMRTDLMYRYKEKY